MITNKTAREFVIAKKLFPDISTSVIETDTATGAIASFETNMSAPIVNGVFEFNPVQEGTGDPSPSNPRPITGFTGLNVTRCGKNLFDYSKSTTSGYSKTNGVYTNTSTDSRAKFYFTIQAFKGSNYVRDLISQQVIETTGTYSYTFSIASTVDYDRIRIKHNGSQRDLIIYYTPFNFKGSFVWSMKLTGCDPSTVGGLSFEECLIAFGTDSTYEPYTATTYPISWQTEAGTVYGGELNATTGELKPFKEYDSYNGETLTGTWLCSQAPYVAGTTPPTGSQVVDLGAYDTTVQLTPQEVRTLLGTNNIYHDCNGDSTITYKKSVPRPTTTDKRQFLPLIYGKKYYRKEY